MRARMMKGSSFELSLNFLFIRLTRRKRQGSLRQTLERLLVLRLTDPTVSGPQLVESLHQPFPGLTGMYGKSLRSLKSSCLRAHGRGSNKRAGKSRKWAIHPRTGPAPHRDV